MTAPASDWLKHFQLLLLNHWTELSETWQEARSQRPLPSLCFSDWLEKKDGHHSLWLAEIFFTSFLKPMNRIQGSLTGSKISTFSTKFAFSELIRKTRWPPQPLSGWDIFNFSPETVEGNSAKLNRKQDLNASTKFVFFGPIKKPRDSDWLTHFRLLWNHWTEYNKIWQEARSQCPLISLCFTDWSEKQDSRTAPDWLRHFQILLWNHRTELNET